MEAIAYFKGFENLELAKRYWKIDQADANIILLHGYAEHSGRYEYEASKFNEAGFSVFAYDHRGHGRSKGERAYIDHFDEYLHDFQAYLDLNLEQIAAKPFFIFCHSMGGLIAISYLLKNDFDHTQFKGLCMSAPALKVHRSISPMLQKVSGVLSKLAPKLQTVPLNNKQLSHDPQVYIDHENDPLNYKGKAKSRMGGEMIRQMKVLQPDFSKFDHPYFLMHGTEDLHAEITGSQMFHSASKSSDKEMIELEGMYHEITKEVEKDKVLKEMIDWMVARR